MLKSSLPLAATLLILTLAGCQHYYRVKEPSSDKLYYTDQISDAGAGSIKFRDLQTGDRVTLQSSVIADVTKDQLPPDLQKK